MTDQQQSKPTENRLDRIEAILERNTQQIEKNATAIIDLRVAVSSLIETSNQFQRNYEIMAAEIVSLRRDFAAMQSEIRGLQVENRRILDRLFCEPENEEGEN